MFKSMEGKHVPRVTFKTRNDGQWADVSTDELFSGRRVVVFSLPGAFTPTCSSTHVPRFNELAPVFKENGIDEIICISVNDPFVMNEWQAAQRAERIRFIPDGTGAFTEGMGMLVNKDNLGFGMRSWRYSMLVEDGIIKKMFIEPEVEGDPFEVSDAETMLAYINPAAQVPLDVVVFSRDGCGYCARAKSMLREHGIEFEELRLNKEFNGTSLRGVAGASTVPQVFINGEHIGDSEKLAAWLSQRNAA